MPRQGVQYVQNEEPAFIRHFKEKVGHKEAPDVDTKRQMPDFSDDEDIEEKEDEKPTVVVLKEGDLTAEEAESEQKQIDEGPARLDEKIAFKKRMKRTADDTSVDEEKKTEERKQKRKSKQPKKRENKSLLSFGDEEEDED